MPFMIIISWVLNHLILSSVEFVRFPQDEKRLGTPGGRSLGTASHQHVLSFLGIQNGTVSGIKSHWKGPGEKNNKKTPGNPRHRLKILIQLGFFRWTKVTFFFELILSWLDLCWILPESLTDVCFGGLNMGSFDVKASMMPPKRSTTDYIHLPMRKIDNIGFGNTNTIKHTSPEDPCIFAYIYHKFKPNFW